MSKKCELCSEEISGGGSPVEVAPGEKIVICADCFKALEMGLKMGTEGSLPPPKSDSLVVEKRFVDQYNGIRNFDMTPSEIISALDERIVGQADAKRSLSLATRRHYRRVQVRMLNEEKMANEMPKENILLIGPTGSGKTYISQTLSKIVGVPFWRQALTSFTEAGYVGSDVENLLSSLVINSGKMVKLAETGILFLDEVDKKAQRSTDHIGHPRDVSGVGVQQALLEMCDPKGAVVNVSVAGVSSMGHPMRVTVPVDTKDNLFIFAGAFADGLSEIIVKRIGGRKKIGFLSDGNSEIDRIKEQSDILKNVQHEDLEQYGFITEFCGRLGIVVVLDPLSKDELRSIMTDIDGAVVKRLQLLADVEGFSLEFTDEAIDAIVDDCYKSGMGARRLSAMCVKCSEHIFFDLPDVVKSKKGRKKISAKVIAATIGDPSVYEVS